MLEGSIKRQVNLATPVYLILLLMIIAGAIGSEYFRTLNNIHNIVYRVAALAIVSLGQTVVMLGGGIDLSVGNVLALSSCILATYNTSFGVLPSILLTLIVGLSFGLINGFGETKLGVPPMVMTLATMSIAKGFSLLIRPTPGGSIPYSMYKLFDYKLGLLSFPLVLILVLGLILFLIIHCTQFGRYLYCVGGSKINAERNGIPVIKIKIISYTICSLLATIAGIVMSVRISSGDALIGETFALDSITAVVIGGTAMIGGEGGILGTLGGALLIAMISNFLNLLGINPMMQYIIKGFILVIALAGKVKRNN
jgi:ribose transport system permease protein